MYAIDSITLIYALDDDDDIEPKKVGDVIRNSASQT
jgi:hypothetical protein